MTQDDALAILKTGQNVFLTGEPGSGKSHTIRQYVAYLRSCGVEPAITASTGIAATHIGGMTIHSWSGIGIAKSLSSAELKEMSERSRLVKRMKGVSVLIIDEVSMLSGATLELVERVCRAVRGNELPFGGLQIVFVGDFFQLPPVSRGEEVAFSFASQAWRDADPTVCYLSEQHRQEDAAFLEVLASVRSGIVTNDHRERLLSRQVDHEAHDVTKLFPHNVDVDRINAARLATLPGESKKFKMSSHGATPLVEQLQRGCLSPEMLELKPGARVMFTKNSFEDGYVNGTTGEVTGYDRETGYPIVQLRTGRYIDVQPDTWAIVVDEQPIAAITQVPLRLAWAMTIHKSQGMSLDAAYVDLSGAFAYGQGYVALSRVRTLAGLHLGGLNARALEVDATVLAEDESFRAKSEAAEVALGKLDAEDLARHQAQFVFQCGGDPGGAPVKPKAKKKGPNIEETLEILCSGKTLAECALIRERTIGTIIEHLEKIRAKDGLPVEKLSHLKGEHDFTEMHLAFTVVGDSALKPAFEHLDGRYSYDALRLARIFFQPSK